MRALAPLFVALVLKPALVLAAAVAIAACLRRHAAAVRHAVWAGAIIVTVALPVLSVALPPLRIPLLTSLIDQGLIRAGRPIRPAPSDAETQSRAAPLGPEAAARVPVRPGGGGTPDRLPEMTLALWMLIASMLGAHRVIAEVRVRRIVRRGRCAPERVRRLFEQVARSNNIRRAVQLRVSNETASPAVTGLLRPVVLLPAAADSWAESELAAVFVHELGHVARHDCLLNFCADMAAAAYWCNPAVRLAARRMRGESERACDDLVLEGGTGPETYAQLLLRFARGVRATEALPSAATAMARPSELESRLLAVLDARVTRTPLPRWTAAALSSVGLLVALPAAALTLQAAPFTAAGGTATEPDQRADSLAGQASERLPLQPDPYRVSPAARLALAGPDSILTSRMVAALAHTPRDEGDLVRERAAWTLSQARDGRLVDPLLEALGARDWRVQAYAAWALADARDPRAVPHLAPLVQHPVWRLRAMAAYALRELRDARSEDAMHAALTDAAWQVRLQAVEYFAALGGPGRSTRLRARLDDRHVAVRLAAERAISSTNP